MTSTTPAPFDDGGGLPDTRFDDGPPSDGRGHEPNYLARRAIAVGVVVAVIAVVAIIVGRILSADDGDTGSAPDSSEWNTVVLVTDDEVRLLDPPTGDVQDRFTGDEALLANQTLATGSTLLSLNGFGRISELDLTDGTIRRFTAPEQSGLALSSENSSIAFAGPPLGGNVVVIDTAARTTRDVGQLAGLSDPLMFVDDVFGNESGTHAAMSDASTFQSVLVDVVNDTTVLLAGQVVALNDDTVVTAQRAGARAELEFYDLEGERRGSVDVPSPQATMLTGESAALIVTADGTVISLGAGGATRDVVRLGDDADVAVLGGRTALGSERLLVSTEDEVVVLDAAGEIVVRADGELLSPATRETACAVIGNSLPSGTAVHVDLETGEVLGDLDGGAVGSWSVDSCVVAMDGDDARVVVRGTATVIDLDGSIAIAPDGTAYADITPRGSRLVPIGDDAGDPVALADETVLVRFARL